MIPEMKLGRTTGGFTKKSFMMAVKFAAVWAVLFVAIRGCTWMFSSKYETVKVIGLSWENYTDLRERMRYNDSCWGDPPRSQGFYHEPTFNANCFQRQDGTACVHMNVKTGACEMRIPTYSRYCDYQYWDWPVIETKTINGNGHTVMWLSFQPDGTSRRESKHGKYTISLKHSDGRAWDYSTQSLNRYRDFQIDDIWELKIPNIGQIFPTKKLLLEKEP